jgi:hypothetical protein
VYAAGSETDGQIIKYDVLWKNGTVQGGDNGNYSVFVSGNDVYTAGGGLFKNGVRQSLDFSGTDGCSVNSVFVSGNDVYAAGAAWIPSGDASRVCVWKNGMRQDLGDARFFATVSSLFVSGNDVYVLANEYDYQNGFKYVQSILWKNGTVENVFSGGELHSQFSSALFVK